MGETKPRRLLVLAVNLTSPGGSQLQIELARAIGRARPPETDVVFVTSFPDPLEQSEGVTTVVVEPPKGWLASWMWFNRTLPRKAADLGASVVFAPGGILSKHLSGNFATMNGINNMLPFTPEHIRYFPAWSKERLRFLILQKLYTRSSRRCDALVVPSRFAIEAMRPYAGDLGHKAFVAPNPIPSYVIFDPQSPPSNPHKDRPFFFYLSVVFWYKNHLGLIEGYRRALKADASLPDLIMAGVPAEADYVRRVREAIDDPALRGRARYLGKIPREDIPGWLHHAAVNMFPSTCETNSFIQSEILGARGVMACSNIGPMPEVAGNAAELFDPRDPDSIADCMIRLWHDEGRRRELRSLAERRAAEFTPEACGRQVWAAVQHAWASFAERRGV